MNYKELPPSTEKKAAGRNPASKKTAECGKKIHQIPKKEKRASTRNRRNGRWEDTPCAVKKTMAWKGISQH